MEGPLEGVHVIELKGLGPAPYAGMLLADMGAEVIVIERAYQSSGIAPPAERDIHMRGKKSIVLDLKKPEASAALLEMIEQSDMLIEGFRPGVMEKLGLGPDVCLKRNPRLVYGRITGWGQQGPLAHAAGHDLNYIALTGALAAIGEKQKPIPPLNLVGDFAGGSLFLLIGMLSALYRARESGKGDVVDAAIVDGTSSLMSMMHTLHALGAWSGQREANLLDGGAPFYRCYETMDNRFVSIACIEPEFYQLMVKLLELDEAVFAEQHDRRLWPQQAQALEHLFRQKKQREWCDLLEGTDACFAPVLDFTEAKMHSHNQARKNHIAAGGLVQPAPAPRFQQHQSDEAASSVAAGSDTDEVLAGFGISLERLAALKSSGAIPAK